MWRLIVLPPTYSWILQCIQLAMYLKASSKSNYCFYLNSMFKIQSSWPLQNWDTQLGTLISKMAKLILAWFWTVYSKHQNMNLSKRQISHTFILPSLLTGSNSSCRHKKVLLWHSFRKNRERACMFWQGFCVYSSLSMPWLRQQTHPPLV